MISLAVVSPLVNRIGWSLPLFVIAFLALWLAKLIYQWTERFNFAEQLTEKDNPAFGTALTGYLIGVTFALTGAFPREFVVDGPSLLAASTELAGQGVLIAVLMRASVAIISHGILHRFGVREEMIRDRNVGTGAVVAGGCIAAGLVLHGALSGTSDTPLLALRDVLIYWATGQVILVAGAWLYVRAVRFDLHQTLEHGDNAAAGFSLGGFLAAVGIVINSSLAGASSDVVGELAIIGISGAIGLVLLTIAALLADVVFLPKATMSKEIAVDKNPAAGLISAACSVAVALLMAQVIGG